MHKNFRLLILFTLVFAMLAGYGGNPIVGTWKLKLTDEQTKQFAAMGAAGLDITVEFKSDGTFVQKNSGGGKSMEISGTWKYEENKLIITGKKLDGKDLPSSNPQTVALSEDKKSFTQDVMGMKFTVVKQ